MLEMTIYIKMINLMKPTNLTVASYLNNNTVLLNMTKRKNLKG